MLGRCLVLACLLMLATAVALADETPSQLSTIGVGPNGFDFMIGTWKCEGTIIEGTQPFRFYIYAKRSGLTNSIVLDWDSHGNRLVDSLNYDPSAKTWHSKYRTSVNNAYQLQGSGTTDITVETQSTSDTGPRIVWPGLRYPRYYGAKTPIRETWTFATPEQFDYLFETEKHGSWIVFDKATCAKQS